MTRVGGVLLLLIGLGFLTGGGWVTVSNIRFKATAERTVGTIVKFERRTSTSTTPRGQRRHPTTTWAPVFEFADASGETQRVTSSYSTSVTTHQIGDKVPVLYARGASHNARIDSFASFWFGPLICLVGALVFSVFGIAMVRKGRRK